PAFVDVIEGCCGIQGAADAVSTQSEPAEEAEAETDVTAESGENEGARSEDLTGLECESFWAAAYVLTELAADNGDRVATALSSSVTTLETRLSDSEARVRAAAASLLSYIAEHDAELVSSAVPDVVDLLDDDYEFVRASAALALGYTGENAAVEALEECASSDPSADVRSAAIEAVDIAEDC
ncbi:HEAT repeat domain-containing protein, partial [Halorussus salinisoli]|uniref:HEAT repeat domain-containing protein n=1 Tax=Halorussus salinisoli TaxID=2558242 RepID=UPI001485A23F